MTIYLDDQATPWKVDNVGQAIAAAMERLSGDRLIVDVRLGPKSLKGDELDACQSQPIGDDDLHLYSANPKELATDTLEQIRIVLSEASGTLQEAADLLQRDEVASAMAMVAESISTWMQTQQAVQRSAALVGVDLEQMTVDGAPVRVITDGILTQLRELKQLLQDNDTVGLADSLAYEWPQRLESWDRLVEALIDEIQ